MCLENMTEKRYVDYILKKGQVWSLFSGFALHQGHNTAQQSSLVILRKQRRLIHSKPVILAWKECNLTDAFPKYNYVYM